MSTIGDNIIKARTELGLTCADLAKLVGTHEIWLRRFELGIEMPNERMISRIAKALGVSQDELTGGEIPPEAKHVRRSANQEYIRRANAKKMLEVDRTTFGGNLKYYRILRNMSMRDLGNRSGVAVTTISAYENGGKTPSPETVVALAKTLGIPTSELIPDEDANKNILDDFDMNGYLDELRGRPELRTLFSLSKNATKDDVDQALAIIDTLKKKRNDND